MKFSEFQYKQPDIEAVCKSYTELIERAKAAKTVDELVKCIDEHEALMRSFSTQETLSEIRHTVDTNDAYYDEQARFFSENGAKVMERINMFYLALILSPLRAQLEEIYPKVIFKNAEMSVKTISPEVIDLLSSESALELDYQKLQASAQLDFRGETLTLAQLGKYKTDPDRSIRRYAFEAEGRFYMDNAAEFDRIYDELVKLRTEIAKKLGFNSFVELAYMRRTRNCYDAEMVKKFRDGVKKYIVPAVAKLKEKQAARLGLDKICLQDDSVLLKEGNPRPIGSFDDTYKAGVELYREMRSETREFIDSMDSRCLFDLVAKPGKAAGGYCTFISDHHAPFIFSNFNGTAGDVEVFTHEGGHAFAFYTADKTCRLLEEGEPTMESCEVHSMSMEFLAWPWLESFYGERTDMAKVLHLLAALFFIPYGTMVDEFQHIVYENPDFTPAQRHEAWAKLEKEYRPCLDFDNLPFYSDGRGWQRQLHIYLYPFYYIDYCLAQTVSLEIFDLMQNRGWDEAWNHYYAFLKQAGRATFTEMLDKADLTSPFGGGSLKGITETVLAFIEGKY